MIARDNSQKLVFKIELYTWDMILNAINKTQIVFIKLDLVFLVNLLTLLVITNVMVLV